MKNFPYVLLLCLSVISVSKAQFTPGNSFLGISAGFYQYGKPGIYDPGQITRINNQRQISGDLRLGIMSGKRSLVGLSVVYDSQLYEQEEQVSSSSFSYSYVLAQQQKIYGIGVFGRLYKMFEGDKIGLFGHLAGHYLAGSATAKYKAIGSSVQILGQDETVDLKGLQAQFTPGIVFFVTKRIGVELTIGSFRFTRITATYGKGVEQVNNEWDFSYGLSSTKVGVNFYLNGNQTPKQ